MQTLKMHFSDSWGRRKHKDLSKTAYKKFDRIYSIFLYLAVGIKKLLVQFWNSLCSNQRLLEVKRKVAQGFKGQPLIHSLFQVHTSSNQTNQPTFD